MNGHLPKEHLWARLDQVVSSFNNLQLTGFGFKAEVEALLLEAGIKVQVLQAYRIGGERASVMLEVPPGEDFEEYAATFEEHTGGKVRVVPLLPAVIPWRSKTSDVLALRKAALEALKHAA